MVLQNADDSAKEKYKHDQENSMLIRAADKEFTIEVLQCMALQG